MSQRFIVQCRLVVSHQENIHTTLWLYHPVKIDDLTHRPLGGKYKIVEIYGEPIPEDPNIAEKMEIERLRNEGWLDVDGHF